MFVIKEIKRHFHHSFLQWVKRRVPRSRSVTLDQKRIFIFPSLPGFCFFIVLFVMLIAAINYQISMAFTLVFLLASVFVVAILHTFANLSGLTITAVRAVPVFAGDRIEFELLVSRSGSRDYYDVTFTWGEGVTESVTLRESSERTVKLHMLAKKRGWFKPKRLLIETFYPLGLLRAWTWVALDFDALVYPCPIEGKLQPTVSSHSEGGDLMPLLGSDDFYDFKQYQPGDSLKHVFWKSYAKGQTLQTKQYRAYAERRVWLDWAQFQGDIEQRLSQLCFLVLSLDKGVDVYGLRLPGIEIPPGSGEQHKARLLKTLALYGGSTQ